jgi:hypothetical protein
MVKCPSLGNSPCHEQFLIHSHNDFDQNSVGFVT